MPKTLKRWTEDDIAQLKSLAGKIAAPRIAEELGRSAGATMVQASKLGISLRQRFHERTITEEHTGEAVNSAAP